MCGVQQEDGVNRGNKWPILTEESLKSQYLCALPLVQPKSRDSLCVCWTDAFWRKKGTNPNIYVYWTLSPPLMLSIQVECDLQQKVENLNFYR